RHWPREAQGHAQRPQRDRPLDRAFARRILPQARRRAGRRHLRHGDRARRADAARRRARARRRQPDARRRHAGRQSQHAARQARQIQACPVMQARSMTEARAATTANRVTEALLSVSDKRGIVDFARALAAAGVALLSTGGTAKALADAGLAVTDVGSYTGFPEMLDGRVKTLHPKVHGGILARRDLPAHMQKLAEHAIPPIDLVVVNLYPFRETIAREGATLDDAIENIDIGGPAMVRSAAKNWRDVAVVVDPDDYPALAAEIDASGGLAEATRFRLASKAFAHTSAYDGAISNYLAMRGVAGAGGAFPSSLRWAGEKLQDLRYGENPHQRA